MIFVLHSFIPTQWLQRCFQVYYLDKTINDAPPIIVDITFGEIAYKTWRGSLANLAFIVFGGKSAMRTNTYKLINKAKKNIEAVEIGTFGVGH